MSLPGVQVAYYLQAAWKTYGQAAPFAAQFRGLDAAWLESQRGVLAAANGGTGPEVRRAFPVPDTKAVQFPFLVVEWGEDGSEQEFFGGGGGTQDGARTWEILTRSRITVHAVAPNPDLAEVLYEWARAVLLLAVRVFVRQGFDRVAFVSSPGAEPMPQYIGEGGGVWRRSQTWEFDGVAAAVEADVPAQVLWSVQLFPVKTDPTPPPFQTAPTDPTDPLPAQRTLDPNGTPGGVVPVEE